MSVVDKFPDPHMVVFIDAAGCAELRPIDYTDTSYRPPREYPELQPGEEVVWEDGQVIPTIYSRG